ncbi:hypothetical protein [Rhodococcus pseudokoreensis]|nr:hypothetical protein [Rhodococcus pseudokoreensis]
MVDSDDIDDFSSIEPGSWDTPYTDRIEQAIEVPLDDGYEVLPH